MYKYDWIWNKKSASNSLMANKRPLKEYENIMVFCKKQSTYNPQKEQRSKIWTRGGKGKGKSSDIYGTEIDLFIQKRDSAEAFPKSILTFSIESTEASRGKRVHPTQKPVALLEYLIKTYTNEGELVLDNCMGSGSTGVACKNTNRDFIGIELDEKYFNIAKERIELA
jgi:site-specific DNA-methyltransferase (adenine-specific)